MPGPEIRSSEARWFPWLYRGPNRCARRASSYCSVSPTRRHRRRPVLTRRRTCSPTARASADASPGPAQADRSPPLAVLMVLATSARCWVAPNGSRTSLSPALARSSVLGGYGWTPSSGPSTSVRSRLPSPTGIVPESLFGGPRSRSSCCLRTARWRVPRAAHGGAHGVAIGSGRCSCAVRRCSSSAWAFPSHAVGA